MASNDGAHSAFDFSQSYTKPVGERVESESPQRVPGNSKTWVGNDKPGRRQLQPHSAPCIIGDGFVRTSETLKQGVLGDTKAATTSRKDLPDEPVWRSSIAANTIADNAAEEGLLTTTMANHDVRRIRRNQSRDVDYYKQSPPY